VVRRDPADDVTIALPELPDAAEPDDDTGPDRSAVSAAPYRAVSDRPRARLTTRAAILGLVVCALVLALSYPVKDYLAQRGQLSSLAADNARRAAAISRLIAAQQELTDPAYIKAQARKRLQYAMPGDTVFVVVQNGARPSTSDVVVKATHNAPATPWYDKVWGSVRAADRAR